MKKIYVVENFVDGRRNAFYSHSKAQIVAIRYLVERYGKFFNEVMSANDPASLEVWDIATDLKTLIDENYVENILEIYELGLVED